MKVFPKSFHCRKNYACILLQLKNNSETYNINEKTSQILFRVLIKPLVTRKDVYRSFPPEDFQKSFSGKVKYSQLQKYLMQTSFDIEKTFTRILQKSSPKRLPENSFVKSQVLTSSVNCKTNMFIREDFSTSIFWHF